MHFETKEYEEPVVNNIGGGKKRNIGDESQQNPKQPIINNQLRRPNVTNLNTNSNRPMSTSK